MGIDVLVAHWDIADHVLIYWGRFNKDGYRVISRCHLRFCQAEIRQAWCILGDCIAAMFTAYFSCAPRSESIPFLPSPGGLNTKYTAAQPTVPHLPPNARFWGLVCKWTEKAYHLDGLFIAHRTQASGLYRALFSVGGGEGSTDLAARCAPYMETVKGQGQQWSCSLRMR